MGHLGRVVLAAGAGTAILVLRLWVGPLRLIWGSVVRSFIFGRPILGWVVWSQGLSVSAGTMTAGPGRWFLDWLPDGMPHFHSIPFDSDWTVVYMRHNVDSCIHVVSLCIDNKHILNLNLNLAMHQSYIPQCTIQKRNIHILPDCGWEGGDQLYLVFALVFFCEITSIKYCTSLFPYPA